MKFYLLTSNSLETLIRNSEIIHSEDLVVVINTRDDNYRDYAEEYCIENDLEYYITPSDGTPATGKNSVIKLFLESDNDYMVQIDGDDFITPLGYRLYKSVSQHPTPPDMIVHYRQPRITTGLDPDYIIKLCEDLTKLTEEDIKLTELTYPCDKSNPQYATQVYETLLWHFMTRGNMDAPTSHKWSVDRVEFNHLMNKFSEVKEYMTRMVFYSRNIAKEIHFDKELIIGEDTLQFLKVKKMALDGKYNVVRRKENRYPTYVTTENDQSVTKIRKNSWEWMRPLIDKINILEERNELPQPYMSLPEFIDDTYA